MNQMLYMLAQAQGGAGAQPGGNPILMIGFMAIFIIFFYFVVIRPQNKQKKEMQKMLDALKKGDKVVTIGGIIGKVASVKENVVTIRVNDNNTEISFEKNAIAKVLNQSAEKADKKADKKDTDDEAAKIEDKSEQSDNNDTNVTEN